MPEVDAEFAKTLGVADGDIAKMREEITGNLEARSEEAHPGQGQGSGHGSHHQRPTDRHPERAGRDGNHRLMENARNDMEQRGMKVRVFPIQPKWFTEQRQAPRDAGSRAGRTGQGEGTPGRSRSRSKRHRRGTDIYSRLLKERVIFLGGRSTEDMTANLVVAHAAPEPKTRTRTSICTSTSARRFGRAGYGDLRHHAVHPPDVSTMCVGQAASDGRLPAAGGAKGKRLPAEFAGDDPPAAGGFRPGRPTSRSTPARSC